MAHTQKQQTKLLNRSKRIRGQIDGIIRLLESKADCTKILNTIAACQGAINGLMGEVLEGHIKEHIVDAKQASTKQLEAADELVYIVKKYLK